MMEKNLPTIPKIRLTKAAFGVLGLFVFSGALLLAFPALAQQDALSQLGAQSGLPQTSLPILVARLIRAALGVIGIVLVVLIVYGGFLWMTAAGEPARIEKAKTVLKNAIIGFVIIMASFSITQFILSRLLQATGLGGGISARLDQFYEPLSGSLGAGILENHFPARNALKVPRNTKIFVTFKEPINPASIIEGYAANSQATDLNPKGVKIFQTAAGDDSALSSTEVKVAVDESGQTFVFDPVPFLGDGIRDVNYTVFLTPNIEKANGSAAFAGRESGGYQWTFEVGTEIDLTPPKVVSVMPSATGGPFARNITVSVTFNEPMDPVAATGVFDGAGFTNIVVSSSQDSAVSGTYAISNNYQTVDFTPTLACGRDPCGDAIYCLPGPGEIQVLAKAAELSETPPQARQIGVSYNGLVDAAGNSLDGDADGLAQGTEQDSYRWNFSTLGEINTQVPKISGLFPAMGSGNVNLDLDVEIAFDLPLKASTLTSENVSLWPFPDHSFWFVPRVLNFTSEHQEAGPGAEVAYTKAALRHPTFLPPELSEDQSYYPKVTQGVKSAYQICLYPAMDIFAPEESNCGVRSDKPYCCHGQAEAEPCTIP